MWNKVYGKVCGVGYTAVGLLLVVPGAFSAVGDCCDASKFS